MNQAPREYKKGIKGGARLTCPADLGRTFAELPYATHFDKPATHSVAQAELQCLLTRSAGWPAHFEGSPRSLRGELLEIDQAEWIGLAPQHD